MIIAAMVGDGVGHSIRRRLGPQIFTRSKSLLFNLRHVERTREFSWRHGPKTIGIARFVPIVRTFAPVLTGVRLLEYRRFLFYNVFGGVGWVVSMTWAGYLLGRALSPGLHPPAAGAAPDTVCDARTDSPAWIH